jgi:uncharacterized membrane protein
MRRLAAAVADAFLKNLRKKSHQLRSTAVIPKRDACPVKAAPVLVSAVTTRYGEPEQEAASTMNTILDSAIDRWTEANLISPDTATRIRTFEAERAPATGSRWQVLVALAAGGVMLAAGVLLFVAAHWDTISPSSRFSLVLLLVAAFHVAGALVAQRFPALSVALHGIGTAALGAGIFLAGQVFNLAEHWPGGVMLWALGAVIGYAILRDWLQATLASLLVPAWLLSEWSEAINFYRNDYRAPAVGTLLLAIAYLLLPIKNKKDYTARALTLIGAVALIPATLTVVESARVHLYTWNQAVPSSMQAIGWSLAIILPLALAAWTRKTGAWMNLVALALAIGLAFSRAEKETLAAYAWDQFASYIICLLGAFGLVMWGIRERRTSGINVGLIGFAVTVMTFYFSNVMDKLGRSVALMGFGLILLVVAWGLEKTRKKLIARMAQTVGGAQ